MVKRTIIKYLISLALVISHHLAWAGCTVLNSDEQAADVKHDPIATLLANSTLCPTNVYRFRSLLKHHKLILATTMVANRGYHNPALGSFSIFEMVSGKIKEMGIAEGDFFFGHFTAINEQGELTLDQNPTANALMIEAFAFDDSKGVYNFYELRGNGKTGQWYYRGDSVDILLDNRYLHRQPNQSQPQFGNRLRCSACHGGGGPIMKELTAPHNDWWQDERQLPFADHLPNAALQDVMTTLVSPERLQKSIIVGIKKLTNDKRYQAKKSALTLAELLRPLFCPMEINFQSDFIANDERELNIAIDSEFFLDSRLLAAKHSKYIYIARSQYEAALQASGSNFPETYLNDADHAWLTPVKAASDKIAVLSLIKQGVIDKHFVSAVLAVDMTNPVFSDSRCQLLQYLPEHASAGWQAQFIENLSKSKEVAAKTLKRNLTDKSRTILYFQQKAQQYLENCQHVAEQEKAVAGWYRLLIQRRFEIAASEISKNPRGQILEPGFRVIFPDTNIKPKAGKWQLDKSCLLSK